MKSALWSPSARYVAEHTLSRFAQFLEGDLGCAFQGDYGALHRWSVKHREDFWRAVWRFCGIVHEGSLDRVLCNPAALPGAQWFPDVRLNYAENLLRHPSELTAVIALDESGSREIYSFGQLRSDVARHRVAMQAIGVGKTSVVTGILGNRYESVAAMLAAASLGATWCSVSPDFGAAGILDRLSQVSPSLLFATRRYRYGGRDFDITPKLAAVIEGLASLSRTVIVDGDPGPLPAISLEQYLTAEPATTLQFDRLPFDHALYVLFTSGTTGVPKAIRHGAGGTLLQLLKEHRLHCDVGPGDRMFFPTTLGWMMWNWLVNGLAAGSAVVLYDGSFAFPDQTTLFNIIERERVTLAGMSGAFIESCRKRGLDLTSSHRFKDVRLVFAGGSVLSPDAHHWAADHLITNVPIASCSGGTDIVSCFLITDPWSPIWPGELQAAGLGMDVAVFDDTGCAITQRKGELVCRAAAPSMPLGFVNDPHGKRYRSAYFDRYPCVWAQGDFAATTEHGGFVIFGRSDAVLNPGGVRIGTAEIYRQVDTIAEVAASVAAGLEIEGDVEIVLFVQLLPSCNLTSELKERIQTAIRHGASPRHVPKQIVAVAEIPMTRSGKIAETAVREVLNGRAVLNIEALANPQALQHFHKPNG